MRKLILDFTKPNYARIGNDHIFIGFKEDDLTYLNNMNYKAIKKIHVFITGYDDINSFLKTCIQKYGQLVMNLKSHAKIIIHLTPTTYCLEKMCYEKLGTRTHWRIIRDGDQVNFKIYNQTPHDKVINGDQYREFYVWFNEYTQSIGFGHTTRDRDEIRIDFPEFKFNISEKNKSQHDVVDNFINELVLENPDVFKERYVSQFKKDGKRFSPDRLKGLTDDDIWEHFTQAIKSEINCYMNIDKYEQAKDIFNRTCDIGSRMIQTEEGKGVLFAEKSETSNKLKFNTISLQEALKHNFEKDPNNLRIFKNYEEYLWYLSEIIEFDPAGNFTIGGSVYENHNNDQKKNK